MTLLAIPEDQQRAILELSSLTESQRNALLDAMKDATPTREIESLVRQIASKSGVPEYSVATTVGLIIALVGVADFMGHTHEETVENVIETIETEAAEHLPPLDSEQLESIRRFLQLALVQKGTLGLSAKAQRIVLEHDRIFLSSEIFTDARTVFSVDDSEVNPAAITLTHMLKVYYRQDGRRKSLYIALDRDDLIQLRDTIDRAAKKEERLSSLFASTGINVLELE